MTAGPFRLPVAVREPQPARRWSPVRVLLLLVLCVLVVLAMAVMIHRAGAKTAVLVLARRVPESAVITRADLTTVPVAGNFSAIGADQLSRVVGHRAAYTLEPGAILQTSAVSSRTQAQADPAGQASVGITVPVGLVPEGLQPGDTVRVVQIPAHDSVAATQTGGSAGSAVAPVLADAALITGLTEDPSSSGDLVVTVQVATDASGPLLVASSWGEIGLVKVSGS